MMSWKFCRFQKSVISLNWAINLEFEDDKESVYLCILSWQCLG